MLKRDKKKKTNENESDKWIKRGFYVCKYYLLNTRQVRFKNL